jgi:hypothetical protein
VHVAGPHRGQVTHLLIGCMHMAVHEPNPPRVQEAAAATGTPAAACATPLADPQWQASRCGYALVQAGV